MTIVPPYLKPGDTVGITCPAGNFSLEDVNAAVEALESWGFRAKLGSTLGTRYYQFSAPDAERAQDLQQMLDAPDIHAILFARGGYGTIRIIDRIHFNRFYLQPKWLCGYSDITVLHAHIQTQIHIPTVHSEMCIDLKYGNADASAASLRRALIGESLRYEVGSDPMNRWGSGSGLLAGGNLSTLCSLMGSPSELQTDGKILFLEEVHEPLYSIDRMMQCLKRAGKLSFLAGLILGGFTHIPEEKGVSFGQGACEIIASAVEDCSYPVCFGFPAGHEYANYALRLGMPHRLEVDREGSLLKEL